MQRGRQLRGDDDDEGDDLLQRRGPLEAAGHLQVLLSHGRRVFPLRHAELLPQDRILDL